MFGSKISIRFWPGLHTRANTESNKDLGDKNRGVQEGQYFTVLTGTIFYGINQSMRFYSFNILKVENKQLNDKKNVTEWMYSHVPCYRSSASRISLRMAVLARGKSEGRCSNPQANTTTPGTRNKANMKKKKSI